MNLTHNLNPIHIRMPMHTRLPPIIIRRTIPRHTSRVTMIREPEWIRGIQSLEFWFFGLAVALGEEETRTDVYYYGAEGG